RNTDPCRPRSTVTTPAAISSPTAVCTVAASSRGAAPVAGCWSEKADRQKMGEPPIESPPVLGPPENGGAPPVLGPRQGVRGAPAAGQSYNRAAHSQFHPSSNKFSSCGSCASAHGNALEINTGGSPS